MMVTFISQCEKKALNRTRRTLDSFADRIGDNTWQTVITQEGLGAVKKLLRKTASKNTAVACHWMRSRKRTELVWVVGSKNKFNSQGVVPVNTTSKAVHLSESQWHNTQVIALLAGIAGLFHDFGKANKLFQNKLKPGFNGNRYEPFRHEWVSLRLFQAFVGDKTDEQWLQALADVDNQTESSVLQVLRQLCTGQEESGDNPLLSFPEKARIAKVIAWLIVSHHKLPTAHEDNRPTLCNIGKWLTCFDSYWISKNCGDDWDNEIIKENWSFPKGTPFSSVTWQIKASQMADKALACKRLHSEDWFNQRFTSHLARLALMLADHYYSSEPVTKKWQDRNYKSYANTNFRKQPKQKLDEHNIGVGLNAVRIAKCLPSLKSDLPCLSRHKLFETKVIKKHKANFGWQDTAYDLAVSLVEESEKFGFFGINMASTGKGKTRGNARIMYGLSKNSNCRFSVALGLRTLTLQTGDVLQEHLGIKKNELAVLVGSLAVRQLHERKSKKGDADSNRYFLSGSESSEPLISDNLGVVSQLRDYAGVLSKWLRHDDKLSRLLQAPILVSTIDYLIPATEGVRGGRQIAPTLRLLTSDLILDEPDDFSLEDLPALCRLVNWAGMLGAKVLLSTATMPPALAYALFEAYQDGRKHYTEVNGELGKTCTVCCAWFDEYNKPIKSILNNLNSFRETHTEFVNRRLSNLSKEVVFRKARLLSLANNTEVSAVKVMADAIHKSLHDLHLQHHQKHSTGKTVSIGLVRMANINPLVAVIKRLYLTKPESNHRIYYCTYHSQYPLAIRSFIEEKLDKALTRHDEEAWWGDSGIEEILQQHNESHHIFVVLATPVAEVGRDHDYDWAIAEPSSMRSLIQLAGRIHRHRKLEPKTENLLILSKNFKVLQGKSLAYCKPGFETDKHRYASHNLEELLKPENYQNINAAPRIRWEKPTGKEIEIGKYEDFVQLEQFAMFQRLLGFNEEDHARLWWQHSVTWCGELQKLQPFRKSSPDEFFCLYLKNGEDETKWKEVNYNAKPAEYVLTNKIKSVSDFDIAEGNETWFPSNPKQIIQNLGSELNISLEKASKKYAEVQLRKGGKGRLIEWKYSKIFGVFEEINEECYLDGGK